MADCTVPGCGRTKVARGWCHPHWKRWRKYGDPAAPTPPPVRRPIEARFWAKVQKADGCWEWTAYCDPQWGYGFFRAVPGETMRKAHRVSWELANGPIPGDLHVLHRCDNPPCVRPDHLFLGTHDDNMADRNVKGRQSRQGTGRRGEAHATAKISDADVTEIRRRYYAGGILQSELAQEYGIAQRTVSQIVRGVSRKDTFDGDHRRTLRARQPKRALTPEQEEIVRQRRRSGETLQAIATDYGVSHHLIWMTVTKR